MKKLLLFVLMCGSFSLWVMEERHSKYFAQKSDHLLVQNINAFNSWVSANPGFNIKIQNYFWYEQLGEDNSDSKKNGQRAG